MQSNWFRDKRKCFQTNSIIINQAFLIRPFRLSDPGQVDCDLLEFIIHFLFTLLHADKNWPAANAVLGGSLLTALRQIPVCMFTWSLDSLFEIPRKILMILLLQFGKLPIIWRDAPAAAGWLTHTMFDSGSAIDSIIGCNLLLCRDVSQSNILRDIRAMWEIDCVWLAAVIDVIMKDLWRYDTLATG